MEENKQLEAAYRRVMNEDSQLTMQMKAQTNQVALTQGVILAYHAMLG